MNNCLVKKLKGSVDNSELIKLGVFRIFPNNGGWFKAQFGDISNVQASQVELTGCYADSNLTSFIINDGSRHQYNITVTGDSPRIDFTNKYNLFRFNSYNIDLNLDLLMPKNIFTFNAAGNISGDITYLAGIVGSTNGSIYPLEEFGVNGYDDNGTAVTGDISELGHTHFLKNISIGGLTKVHGDLSNLGYSAISLNIIYLPFNKNIHLEVIDFVKKARKVGVYRDSSHKIKFSGARRIDITLNEIFYDSNVCELYWTANKIYAFGLEIDNSEVEP